SADALRRAEQLRVTRDEQDIGIAGQRPEAVELSPARVPVNRRLAAQDTEHLVYITMLEQIEIEAVDALDHLRLCDRHARQGITPAHASHGPRRGAGSPGDESSSLLHAR